MIGRVLGLLAAVVVGVGGCTAQPFDTAPSSSDATPPPPAASDDIVGLLAELEVIDHVDIDDYERDEFGTAWSDIDDNGCNQRDDVLLRDGVDGTVTIQPDGACDHDVVAGEWNDPYTGQRLVFDDLKDTGQAQAIQIDHIVPLAEAWRSGAAGWDEQTREEFANDLTVLVAVDGSANMAKGDDDPATWLPENEAYRCQYATDWVSIKHTWGMTVDTEEVDALHELLDACST